MNIKFLIPIFLLLSSLSFIAFTAAPQGSDKQGCVVDESGKPMVYVDIKNAAGELLMQTDVNGCFVLAQEVVPAGLTLHFPGYEPLSINEVGGNYTLYKVKHLPPVYRAGEATVYPTESRGEYAIEGAVIDEAEEPLIGASILIDGTTRGTVTDMDGRFRLMSATACARVTVSYTGFESRGFDRLCNEEKHRLVLKEGVALDEVVVTGLGTKRRRKDKEAAPAAYSMDMESVAAPPPATKMIRGAITSGSTLTAEEIRSLPTRDISALAATSPGISTTTKGEAPTVRGSRDDATSYYVDGVRAASTPAPEIAVAEQDLPEAGQLTAGEINDFSKWDMWEDISKEDLGRHRGHWHQYADHRYTLQLTTPTGAAVVNAIATLEDGQGNALWQTRTDAQGRAELWAHYFRDVATPANGLSIQIEYADKKRRITNAKPFREGINFETLSTDCREDAVVDIAFVVDATGSMSDEISYLQAELLDVVSRVRTGLPGVDLQMGSVFYRDHNEEYLTRVQPFTADDATAVNFIKQQGAQGGGDYPEAVETALESALDSLAWRDNASTRLLFLVLDAPPHRAEENVKRLQVAITQAAQRGIQIIPVSCSGVDKSTEFLLRSMALATNGTYTFITDHSGIGDSHIEPSTDTYEVEHLNDVLARLSIERSKLGTCVTLPMAAIDPLPPSDERDWAYYPNPTNGPLTLQFPPTDGGTLYLADAQGKLLAQYAPQQQFNLDLSSYPAGTYWLRHQAADGAWTEGQVVRVF